VAHEKVALTTIPECLQLRGDEYGELRSTQSRARSVNWLRSIDRKRVPTIVKAENSRFGRHEIERCAAASPASDRSLRRYIMFEAPRGKACLDFVVTADCGDPGHNIDVLCRSDVVCIRSCWETSTMNLSRNFRVFFWLSELVFGSISGR
jgi:hypothetical protein